MEKKTEQIHPDGWLKDLPVQAQNEGFKQEEMVACPKCARLSPPNRLNCFYCGAELPVTETQQIKPSLRKLENWEKGFNVIRLPEDKNIDDDKLAEIAKLLKLENEDLKKIFSANKPLPITRAESETEAEIVVKRLKEFNIESIVLSDEKLKPDAFTRRLRGIEFFEDRLVLILFNVNEIVEILPDDLSLIVGGNLIKRKIEASEKYNRKKENKILSTAEISNDELVIDIYSKNDEIGYRIEAKGFDFSCLGAEKQLLVAENMKRLSEKLKAFAPDAKYDDDYKRIRAELGGIWEVEQRKDSRGLQKKGIGALSLESTITIDNLSQFTKYSRLQWHLL